MIDRRNIKVKHLRVTQIVFFLTLALVFFVGLALLYWSNQLEHSTYNSIHSQVEREIQHEVPQITSKNTEKLSVILKEWEGRLISKSLFPEILRDVALAMLISVFVIIVVELYAGVRFRDDLAYDVFEAVLKKIVPDDIFKQLKNYVFSSNIKRRDWTIRIDIGADSNIKDSDLYITNTTISYSIENLYSTKQEHFLRCGLDIGFVDKARNLPHFERVSIGGDVYNEERLKELFFEGKKHIIRKNIELPPPKEGDMKIVIEMKQILRVPDTFCWSCISIADGFKVIITNKCNDIEFNVHPIHPSRDELNKTQTLAGGEEWVFTEGLLPWQGVEIQSSGKEKQ